MPPRSVSSLLVIRRSLFFYVYLLYIYRLPFNVIPRGLPEPWPPYSPYFTLTIRYIRLHEPLYGDGLPLPYIVVHGLFPRPSQPPSPPLINVFGPPFRPFLDVVGLLFLAGKLSEQL